tara:strand:- start:378 stop:1556 length:1179 start_codon:yes stop_codon:yes gene_type:complete
MRIDRIETLYADAGWRDFAFVKITADNGLVGYSEYQEGFGSPGVSTVVQNLAPQLLGQDAMAHENLFWQLYATTRPAAGGVVAQGLGAIENALLDLKGKHLGVPCYELLGGKLRDRIRLYWSHCGTWRVNHPAIYELEPLRSLDQVVALGKEVADRGFGALKTNLFRFGLDNPGWTPGFNRPGGYPELNADAPLLQDLRDELAAFREGAGPEMDILLDTNFNYKTDGYRKIMRIADEFGLYWLELDSYDAKAVASIRQAGATTLASCETLIGIREFRPFFDAQAMDVAIIDAVWNGIWQSMKIAALAEAHEVNIAPHNFYGHLSTLMNAHFVAAVPNFRIMEIDIDNVPWQDALFTHAPEIEDGYLLLPDRPGWGTEPDEAGLAKHPPRKRR